MSEIKVNSIKGVGASTAAITVNNSDGTCTANITNNLSNRNLIINGAMQVAQRGTSEASITSSGYYTIDRFRVAMNTGTITASQSTDVPTGEGFANSFKVDVTTANNSLGATDFLHVQQAIEGQNLQSLAYGTSSAKTITLSFFVKSNKTGIYCISLEKTDNTRYDYTAEYTISSANTWEKKTINIAPDSNIQASAGAIDNNNDKGFNLKFCLAAGGDRDNGVNNTWNAGTNHSTSNQLNLLDSTSNEWYITGVQLEVDQNGSGVATDFEHRSFHDEMQRCRRYYLRLIDGDQQALANFTGFTATSGYTMITAPVQMRATPSLVQSTGTNYYRALFVNGQTDFFDGFYAVWKATKNVITISVDGQNISHGPTASFFVNSNSASASLAFSSEL